MKTPRTDAMVIEPRPVVVKDGMAWQPEIVYAIFARQLETENAELREALADVEEMLCDGEWTETKKHLRALLEKTK